MFRERKMESLKKEKRRGSVPRGTRKKKKKGRTFLSIRRKGNEKE